MHLVVFIMQKTSYSAFQRGSCAFVAQNLKAKYESVFIITLRGQVARLNEDNRGRGEEESINSDKTPL